jgi:cysteinyl-tRNA synthetase
MTKMSKSIGNIYTLRDILEMGYSPEALRYLLASVPYRKKLNFTFDGLHAAQTSIDRLRNFQLRLQTASFADGANPALDARAAEGVRQFEEALDDDLNTAEALAAVFEYIRDANTAMDAGEFRSGNVAAAQDLLRRFDAIFDVLCPTVAEGALSDAEVEALVEERTQAKKKRDFGRADEIRNRLLEAGVIVEDTKDGARWKRKS